MHTAFSYFEKDFLICFLLNQFRAANHKYKELQTLTRNEFVAQPEAAQQSEWIQTIFFNSFKLSNIYNIRPNAEKCGLY